MKKGLSALLIAAALFGFYGGAVNLNDVLACKDYWEAEDERTTADLNKLEDGLNQLKENEQAYLDGLDALADGEEALAQGEADYAAGQKELAKGEADYAAAPGKLAAARKQIAKGEQDLADGEETLAAGKQAKSGLDKLIDGLNQIKTGYLQQWQPGFEDTLTQAELAQYMAGQSSKKPGLKQAREVIVATLNSKADDIALIEKIAKANGITDDIVKASSYKAFDSAVANPTSLFNAFDTAKVTLAGFASMATNAANDPDLESAVSVIGMSTAQRTATEEQLGNGIAEIAIKLNRLAELEGMTDRTPSEEAEYNALKEKESELKAEKQTLETKLAAISHPEVARDAVKTKVSGLVGQLGDNLALVNALDPTLYSSIEQNVGIITTNSSSTSNQDYAAAITTLAGNLNTLAGALNGKVTEIDTNKALLSNSFTAWHDGYTQLKEGEKTLADPDSKLPFIFKNMLSNSTIREVINDKASALVGPLTAYSGSRLVGLDVDQFDAEMNELCKNGGLIDKCIQLLNGIRAEATKKLDQGEKDLAAGKAKLAAGKKEYAKGLADYKAAPGKLANGRAQLAEGLQKLMDGRKELADGKEKLAEYEDGEQQVRDGLATLMASEANGGLQSILDRRSGDEDFDNGDEHLELDEGLDAVSVGREYKADSGELVTAEIMKRAIGTGLGLAAGALAVLAGLLSLLKKNKGAGVCAALTAIAGGAGIATGTSAGLEFSSIAGSAVGATPWIAFGVLAAVAAVHAIAHFAAKPEA